MVRTLFIACLFLMPIQAYASSWCKMDKAVNVRIIPKMSKIKYDFSKSFQDLSKVKVNHNPYGANAITHTFGIASGQFQIEHHVKFKLLSNPNTNETCMWYDAVDVYMKMAPEIFVASEYKKGGCHHKEVMAHELEHVDVDKQVTNEYAQKLGQLLVAKVTEKSLFGPFPTSKKERVKAEMQNRLNAVVKANNQAMVAERNRRQALVDSLENYHAISDYLHDTCDRRSPLTKKRVEKKL